MTATTEFGEAAKFSLEKFMAAADKLKALVEGQREELGSLFPFAMPLEKFDSPPLGMTTVTPVSWRHEFWLHNLAEPWSPIVQRSA